MKEGEECCPGCEATLIGFPRNCFSCGSDLGFPNVRLAVRQEEVGALERRFEHASILAADAGVSDEFAELASYAQDESQVVVAMPATTAISFFNSDKSNYTNYEALVSSGARSPANYPDDAKRIMVSGSLFGGHGPHIVYAALSLDGRGLSTYGDLFVTLKAVAIEKRISFLGGNSYDLFDKFGADVPPLGYRADWTRKGMLVAIKLMEESKLRQGQGKDDWAQLVLSSDGNNRNRDEFIEAHIYDPFNLYSIDNVRPANEHDRNGRNMTNAAIKLFESLH